MDRDCIVIGSGVIGLSSARCLQAAGYRVRILSAEPARQTTSMAAGAIWSGSAMAGVTRDWARESLNHFLELADDADSGVTLEWMREVFYQPIEDPWYRDLLPDFQRMTADELPPGLVDGWRIQVPIVAPPVYLPRLERQFLDAGGAIEMRRVGSLTELADEAPLLVNCSGVGARQLARDARVYPMRGQTLLLDAPDIKLGYMDNSRIDHIFPRGDGVLIGGVKIDGDDRRELNPAIKADILERTARIESRILDAPVLAEFTGLRPGRDVPRLEMESLRANCRVIHNYGHGSVGYTLSWGCALAVARLAETE